MRGLCKRGLSDSFQLILLGVSDLLKICMRLVSEKCVRKPEVAVTSVEDT